MNYTWKIEAVNVTIRSMVVTYVREGGDRSTLNIPFPGAMDQLVPTIERYAPIGKWKAADTPPVFITGPEAMTLIGQAGASTFVETPPDRTEQDAIFKKRVAVALFALGVTPTDLSLDPVPPAP